MSHQKAQKRINTRSLVIIAVFAALASILFMLDFPMFPAVPFYKLDFSNLPVMLVTFSIGPIEGLLTLLIKDLTGLLHSSSGFVGELADFLMSAAFLLPAGLIYRKHKNRKMALIGMAVGVVIGIAAAIVVNLFILFPFYGVGEETLVRMGSKVFPFIRNMTGFVVMITGLFNLIKGGIICILCFIIYKPLSPILHGKRVR